MIEQEAIRSKLSPAMGTNAGLWLDKYISKQHRDEKESRRKLINEVVELPEPPEYEAFYRRWEATFQKENVQTRKVRV